MAETSIKGLTPIIDEIENIRKEKKMTMADMCTGVVAASVYSKYRNGGRKDAISYDIALRLLSKMGYTIQIIRL